MDNQQARARLEAERGRLISVRDAADHLVAGATTAEATELSSIDQHPADTATETIERELDGSVLARAVADLREVEAALERIEAGTYGRCEVCGQAIGEGRLEATPATRFCVVDAARAQRDPTLRPV